MLEHVHETVASLRYARLVHSFLESLERKEQEYGALPPEQKRMYEALRADLRPKR